LFFVKSRHFQPYSQSKLRTAIVIQTSILTSQTSSFRLIVSKNCRGRYGSVSEYFLDRPDVISVFEHVGRNGVSQIMQPVFHDAAGFHNLLDSVCELSVCMFQCKHRTYIAFYGAQCLDKLGYEKNNPFPVTLPGQAVQSLRPVNILPQEALCFAVPRPGP